MQTAITMCSDHWSVEMKPGKTIYRHIDSEATKGAIYSIQQVSIDEGYGLDKIVLTGQRQRIWQLYKEIKESVDPKYTQLLTGTISMLVSDIWICCNAMYRNYPRELDELLEKIYGIINREMPHFSEISEKINNELISLGKRRGIAYFHQINPSQNETCAKFTPNSLNLLTSQSRFLTSILLENSSEQIVKSAQSTPTKNYWLSYMQDKIERFRTVSRPNPLPCTGCWGVKQNSCCLSGQLLTQIKEKVSLLEIQTPKPLIEYEEGDWGDWSGYPRDKWSSMANQARNLWGPVFLAEDRSSDDVYNGCNLSAKDSDEAVGRIMGFSCNDDKSPLRGIYFLKQRCTSTSIAITLFANEVMKDEFESWLMKTELLPIVQPVKITGDEYLRHGGDKAAFYKPARFFEKERGIFATIVMEDIERLRMIFVEHCYQIEPAYEYAFNNICNAQTGVAPYRMPD